MLPEYSNLNPIFLEYANDVMSGAIVACNNIKLACKRYLDWFDRTDIEFRPEMVQKKIDFVNKMKHWQGPYAGKYFHMLPFQFWIFCNIFGWYYRETNKRVIRNVFIFVARKNGKTALAAAISLACMCKDGEQGAEVNLIANNRKQALIAFEDCQNYSRSLDPKHKYLTVYRDSIKFSKTNSKLQVLASDSMGLDGYRSHMFLIDEFHAAKTWDLYNVMKRSQGVQENPLAIIITTAGYLQSGYPCYDMRIACIDILRGFKHDDSQFSAIYELDEGDDWQDENVWIKANPSLGVALRKDAVQDYVTQAINVPSTLFDTLTKQFNIFMGSKNVWIKDKYILNSSVLIDLEDFRGETCYMGVDLSAVSDLTSWTVLFPPNPDRDKYPDKFVFKTFAYVPQEALDSENGQKYKEWIQREQLHMTSGNAVDYDKILLDQQNIIEQYELCCYKVSYDSYNATQYATNALSVGLPMEAFSQSLGSFNRPTKGFEILMLNGKVILDMNLVTKWCFQNAELKEDFNNNVKPIKPNNNQDKARKIDCVISIVQSLGGFLIDQQYGYESTTATDSNE